MKFLANENFPLDAVTALRQLGHEVVWIRTESPGVTDEVVLARAIAENRVLLTFDKDFGELAFRRGLPAVCGIMLFRTTATSGPEAAHKVVAAVSSRMDWPGHFTVVDDQRIRMRPLPTTHKGA
jgi:predicted nuclease of predicted toxin-antitoxin system